MRFFFSEPVKSCESDSDISAVLYPEISYIKRLPRQGKIKGRNNNREKTRKNIAEKYPEKFPAS